MPRMFLRRCEFLGSGETPGKFIGDEKEIDILCPMCGTKTKGKVEVEAAPKK